MTAYLAPTETRSVRRTPRHGAHRDAVAVGDDVALGQALFARVAVALNAGDQQALDLAVDLVGLARRGVDRREGQAQGLDLLGRGLVGRRRSRAILALIRRPVPGEMELSLADAVAALEPLLALLLPAPGALLDVVRR